MEPKLNAANRIRTALGMPVGWGAPGKNAIHRKSGSGRFHNMAGPFINDAGVSYRRSDKMDAMHGDIPQSLRRYGKRLSHVLTDHITDKNKAALANRAKSK